MLALLLAYVPLIRAIHARRASAPHYILSVLGLIYASNQDQSGVISIGGFFLIGAVYLWNWKKEGKDLPREERYKKRLELEKPLIDEFWKWIYDTAAVALPKSKLGKAIAYAINQKPYMENYLKDGRCSLSNNVAENAIRPFTVGRKNWLFCDTPKGADSSAVIYSIVETSKSQQHKCTRLSGVSVYSYADSGLEKQS